MRRGATNPAKRCRICGGKCKANVRFCPLCARDRKRERGWRDKLRFFEKNDRKAARELNTQLLKFGVEIVPIAGCDKEHFCFKLGCDGHKRPYPLCDREKCPNFKPETEATDGK